MRTLLKNIFTTENTEVTEKDLAKSFVAEEKLSRSEFSHFELLTSVFSVTSVVNPGVSVFGRM